MVPVARWSLRAWACLVWIALGVGCDDGDGGADAALSTEAEVQAACEAQCAARGEGCAQRCLAPCPLESSTVPAVCRDEKIAEYGCLAGLGWTCDEASGRAEADQSGCAEQTRLVGDCATGACAEVASASLCPTVGCDCDGETVEIGGAFAAGTSCTCYTEATCFMACP